MAKESERMHLLRQNFMELHQQGFSIPEIAHKYNLSPATVYGKLQKIADENGVSRQSLLQIVRTPSERLYREEAESTKVNMQQLTDEFRKAMDAINFLLDYIDDTLRKEEENVIYES